jgi:hypothetical protein
MNTTPDIGICAYVYNTVEIPYHAQAGRDLIKFYLFIIVLNVVGGKSQICRKILCRYKDSNDWRARACSF